MSYPLLLVLSDDNLALRGLSYAVTGKGPKMRQVSRQRHIVEREFWEALGQPQASSPLPWAEIADELGLPPREGEAWPSPGEAKDRIRQAIPRHIARTG